MHDVVVALGSIMQDALENMNSGNAIAFPQRSLSVEGIMQVSYSKFETKQLWNLYYSFITDGLYYSSFATLPLVTVWLWDVTLVIWTTQIRFNTWVRYGLIMKDDNGNSKNILWPVNYDNLATWSMNLVIYSTGLAPRTVDQNTSMFAIRYIFI